MGLDFLNELSIGTATIPAVINRLSGFFLFLQALLIVVQKKNDPFRDIWEDLSGVLLAGLVVYLFPELIRMIELLVNAVCPAPDTAPSELFNALADSFAGATGDLLTGEDHGRLSVITALIAGLSSESEGSTFTFMIASCILKPLADFVNTLCFPTYLIIRAVSLKIVYWVAPLVVVLGALKPFRSLWKHWLMIYAALLVAGPALFVANNFCEECFSLYVTASGSPILGFIVVALARFKAFQAVIDLCYRIFRV